MPISHDLIWPGHPEIRGTTLFPQEDDPMTRAAGGLNPDERWKVSILMTYQELGDLQ